MNIEWDGDKEVTEPAQRKHYVKGSDSLSHRSKVHQLAK
jgi:hypothetical protein